MPTMSPGWALVLCEANVRSSRSRSGDVVGQLKEGAGVPKP